MKDSNKGEKFTINLFRVIAITVTITGIIFSVLIAIHNDAPGFVLFGTAAILGIASLLYGLGEIIGLLKKNNVLLSNISDKLDKGK